MNWAWLVTAEPDPLGTAGRDLDARWKDPTSRRASSAEPRSCARPARGY